MGQVFVPTATPQVYENSFQTGQRDLSITQNDPAKQIEPLNHLAQAYEQYHIKVQEQEDEAAALSAANDFTLKAQNRLTDLKNKQNDAAAEDYKTFEPDIQRLQKDVGSKLSGRSAQMYNKITNSKVVDFRATGYAFNAERATTQITQELTAATENSSQQAVASWGTAEFNNNMATLDDGLKALALHQGIDPNSEKYKELVRKGHADVYKAGIANRIASKQYGAAMNDLNVYGSSMDQFDVLEYKGQIRGMMIEEAEKAAAAKQAAIDKMNDARLKAAVISAGSDDPKIKEKAVQEFAALDSVFPYVAEAYRDKTIASIIKDERDALEKFKASEQEKAWSAYNDYTNALDSTNAEKQGLRYLDAGGDFAKLEARDKKLALSLKEKMQAELEKKNAKDKQDLTAQLDLAEKRKDDRRMAELLQEGIDRGYLSKEYAQGRMQTFVYTEKTAEQKQAISQEEEFIKMYATQHNYAKLAEHIQTARALGVSEYRINTLLDFYNSDEKQYIQKEQEKIRDKVGKTTLAAADSYKQSGHYEEAFKQIEAYEKVTGDTITSGYKKVENANALVKEKVDLADRMYKQGYNDNADKTLQGITPYLGYVSSDTLTGYILKVNETKSENFVKIIDDMKDVNPSLAMELIQQRGQSNLTPSDYSKIRNIAQGLINADYTSVVNNYINAEDAAGLGQLLFVTDKNGNQKPSEVAKNLSATQPDLLRKALTEYEKINKSALESDAKTTMTYKGFSPVQYQAAENKVWDSILNTTSEHEGLIDVTLVERKLPFTAQNKAAIKRELLSNPELIAEVKKRVKDLSDAKYRTVCADASREYSNVKYGISLVNKAVAEGKIAPESIRGIDNVISVLPAEYQQKFRALYGNTDDAQKEFERDASTVNRNFNQDYIGRASVLRDELADVEKNVNSKSLDEYQLHLSQLFHDGKLSMADRQTLVQSYITARDKKYNKVASDVVSDVQDLLAQKLFNEKSKSKCTPEQRLVISANLARVMEKSRELTGGSDDPKSITAGLKLAFLDKDVQRQIGIDANNAQSLSDAIGDGDLLEQSQILAAKEAEDKLVRKGIDVEAIRRQFYADRATKYYTYPKYERETLLYKEWQEYVKEAMKNYEEQ